MTHTQIMRLGGGAGGCASWGGWPQVPCLMQVLLPGWQLCEVDWQWTGCHVNLESRAEVEWLGLHTVAGVLCCRC